MEAAYLPSNERTLRNERRDFPEWHCGRAQYALWALKPDCAALDARVQAAQAHLAEWLLDGYRRQPHVTLGLCGFLSAAPTRDDDFGAGVLQSQLSALRQLRPAPFGIQIGGLDSFTSAPYLTVQADAAPLRALRQCLAGNAAINTPQDQYRPHVTVGLYGDDWPLSVLQDAFGHFAHCEALPLHIRGIQLLSYAAREIGGPLQLLADYDFAQGNLRWNAPAQGLPAPFHALA